MEKKKYSLCLEVLRRLKNAEILDEIMLVGSWCILIYNDFFEKKGLLPPLRTRDLDILFPIPLKLKNKTDLFELLKDLGFILDYKGEQGYMTFSHPDLILEFIVPARGKETNKPFPIDQLGINAQSLRFMDMFSRAPIRMFFEDLEVTVPHPADFALHKLLISRRRKQVDKREKDIIQATSLLRALNEFDKTESIKAAFEAIPEKWQKVIQKELIELGEETLLTSKSEIKSI